MITTDITGIGVVVPAHNEERLLAGCLTALAEAARRVPIQVRTLVVLDNCTDGSHRVCRHYDVESREIDARNVGAARSVGFQTLIGDGSNPETLWLASTDADSRVEPTWLSQQLDLAREGADVVLGVVQLDQDSAGSKLRRDFDRNYQRHMFDDGTHDHVHGANLGLRASTYLHTGGFSRLPNHEDRRLIQRLRRTPGVIIERSQQLIVSTSARLDGRCNQGFAATLAGLEPPGGS